MSLEWGIVGGGLHGVHIALRLLAEGGVDPKRLRIIDPGERLLQRWLNATRTTGMRHLRSPVVHHLDMSPWSLEQFAGKRRRRKPGLFAAPYNRPALGLFNAHCQYLIESYGLAELHVRAKVERGQVEEDGVRLELSSGAELSVENVVLAMGASDQPYWPCWAPRGHAQVHHVFAPDFEGWPTQKETLVVVGAGISGGQIALRLIGEGHEVHLISRHPLREHQFDSDPGWLGPKYMRGFELERDVDRRRALISEARHRGSVPPDVRLALSQAIDKGHLHWHQSEVDCLEARDAGVAITLKAGPTLHGDRVLLATGFETCRPGGAFIDDLVTSESLPCAACGYPIVGKDLRWHPRIVVTGPLAELELGPSSRNISGVRRAGDRLVDTLPPKRESAPSQASYAR